MRTAKQKGKSEKMGSELEGSHFFPKLNIFLRSLKHFKNIGENGVEKKMRRLPSVIMMAVTWCLKLPGTGVQWQIAINEQQQSSSTFPIIITKVQTCSGIVKSDWVKSQMSRCLEKVLLTKMEKGGHDDDKYYLDKERK